MPRLTYQFIFTCQLFLHPALLAFLKQSVLISVNLEIRAGLSIACIVGHCQVDCCTADGQSVVSSAFRVKCLMKFPLYTKQFTYKNAASIHLT